jgi:Tfp pilus assembly protein PilF
MAPEQLRAGAWDQGPIPLDVHSDLFALGVILYELLTGKHPFGPIPARGTFSDIPARLLECQRRGARPLRQWNPRVSHRLARVVGQCLAFAPEDRPQALDQVSRELRKDLRRPRVVGRWVVRHRRFILGIALGMMLFLSGAVTGVYGPRLWQDYQQRHRLADARAFIRTGNYTEAIQNLTRFIELEPANPRARLLRAKAYLRNEELEEGVADLREAALRDQDGRVNAFLGFLVQVGKEPKKAIPYYQAAIAKGFGPAEVYNNLGYCYLRTAQGKDAMHYLTGAMELNPALQAAYYNRGYLGLMQVGGGAQRDQIPEAIRDIEKAIQLGPQTAALYRCAASLHALAAESDPTHEDRALDYLSKAVGLGIAPREFEADAYFSVLRQNSQFQRLIRSAPVPPAALPETDLQLADLHYLSQIIFAE